MDEPPGPRRPGRRAALLLGAAVLYLVPVLLGFLLALENRDNPFFTSALSDGSFFMQWARDVDQGKGLDPAPFYLNPLYPLLLILAFKLGVTTIAAVQTVQILVGALIYPMVFLLARRHFGALAGWAAWALLLGYGPLLLGLTELSSAWLEALLSLLFLLLIQRREKRGATAASGLVAGLAALARPSFLLLGAAVPVALAVLAGREGRRSWARFAGAAVFLGAFALAVLPVTARNLLVGKDLVAVSSHGGINFYIGNNPDSGGIFYAPPGMHEDPVSINKTDSRALAEKALGRPLRPSEASRYWMGRGWSFLLSSPGAALRLYARKGFLAAHSFEVPSNSDYSLFREGSRVLRSLPVPFALLLVLGGAGAALSWGRRRELAFPLLLLGLMAVSLLAFIISSRLRLPMAPLLAVLSGGAAAWGWTALRRAPLRAAGAGIAAGLAVLLLSLPYPAIEKIRGDGWASAYEMLGTYYFEEGRVEEARTALLRAVEIRPAIRHAHWYLARIHELRGERAAAAREWLIASRLYDPGSFWAEEAARNYRRLAEAPGTGTGK